MLVLYETLAIGIKQLSEIDITLPCIWHLLFNVECPGCGMTRATEALLFRHSITEAWRLNPLVFAVLPVSALWTIQVLTGKLRQAKRLI